ncbi:hypothetical protein NE686_22660, partial [Tissierella carlieri]
TLCSSLLGQKLEVSKRFDSSKTSSELNLSPTSFVLKILATLKAQMTNNIATQSKKMTDRLP